jgi:alpha/beta superfamily hydrolase
MPTPCVPDNVVVESLRFLAGAHRLEGELAYPELMPPTGAAVLAGPHPLLGGTLHNNVVRTLGDGLAGRGLASLRFNYRGVGQSEGPSLQGARQLAEFWQNSRLPGEEEFRHDLLGAVGFVRSLMGAGCPLALVGYSFGCTLLPWAIPTEGRLAVVLIAPTVGRHDLDSFVGLNHPKLVIAPEGDFATDAAELTAWFGRLAEPKELIRPTWDGHFFRQHEQDLTRLVGAFLEDTWR